MQVRVENKLWDEVKHREAQRSRIFRRFLFYSGVRANSGANSTDLLYYAMVDRGFQSGDPGWIMKKSADVA